MSETTLRAALKASDASLNEYIEKCVVLEARVKELEEALQAASDHLDYCGYGDSWERECAEAQGLEEKISRALRKEE